LFIISRLNLLSLIIFSYGFIISFFFIPLHFGGDAVHYTAAYNAVANESNILKSRVGYLNSLYSYEIGQFLIYFYYSSLGLDKILLDSLSNGVLYLLGFRLAYNYGNSFSLAFLLILTNYYIFTFLFTLEKLKFSIIFLFLGLLIIRNGRDKLGSVFLFISALSHFQIVIYYISHSFEYIFKKNIHNKKCYLLLLIIISLISFLILSDYIISKLDWYIKLASEDSLYNFSKIFVFGSFVYILSGMKKEVAFFYVCLSSIALVIGSDRVMMFAYFYFISVAFNARKYGMLALYTSIAYMSYRSCKYIVMVVQTGG